MRVVAAQQAVRHVGLDGQQACDAHQIKMPLFQRRVHAGRGAEAAGDHQRHIGVFAHLGGKRQKIRFAPLRRGLHVAQHHRRRLVVAAGDFDQVDAGLGQRLHGGQRLVFGESALLKIGRVELDANGKIRPHQTTHGAIHRQHEPAAVGRRAAPLVVTPVVMRRQELADQIPVGTVNLHAGKARQFGDARGVGIALDQVFDLVAGERARRREQPRQLGLERDGGRRDVFSVQAA